MRLIAPVAAFEGIMPSADEQKVGAKIVILLDDMTPWNSSPIMNTGDRWTKTGPY